MFEPKIKVSKALYEKLKAAAEDRGYASVEEFASHVLDAAVAGSDEDTSEEEVRKRMQGLGYLG